MSDIMKSNKEYKKVKKTDLSVTVALIIGIIVVVNFISSQLFFRLDLTQNKIYSISEVTKNSLGELDDIVNIKAYFSDNLPSQIQSVKQEVFDILSEYEVYSGGKIRVEHISPDADDEEVLRELYFKGIPQLTFEVVEKDQMQLVNGFMGIEIKYGDNSEVIPAVKQNTSDLEYQLTTAIKKVIVDELATIGILKSQGTVEAEQVLKASLTELNELYNVIDVNLAEEDVAIPEAVDTLVVIGPEDTFSDEQLKAINSFLERGGALLVMAEGVRMGEGLVASTKTTGLESLLEQYGIKLNQNIVADTRSGMASFSQGFMTFTTAYPFWPKITREGFSQENAAVAQLENVILPWPSSVEVDDSKISQDSYQYLISTTEKSWALSDNFNITPNANIVPQGEQKIRNLAVSVNGLVPNPYGEEEKSMINARIVVVGDSDFPQDNFLRQAPDNIGLFQNLVDILSFDEDLIAIRSKVASSRPIEKDLSDSSKAAIRYFNIFGVTVLVLVFGLGRYYLRRRSKFVDEL